MAEKKGDQAAYKSLRKAIRENDLKSLYLFYGEERYLLEESLRQIRRQLIAPETEEFNHKRFEGKNLTVPELEQAVDALPVFAERTLVEVHDFNLFGAPEAVRADLLSLFQELPDYLCLIFVYDTVEYKLHGNLKYNGAIRKLLEIVEFPLQKQSDLISSVLRRFSQMGKQIERADAEYLVFITGGLIISIMSEIEKVAAYCRDDTVRRSDIDAVVTPVLDAVVYKLADCIVRHDYSGASGILSELLQMQEAPHKILFSVSLRMRQLLGARICIDNGRDLAYLKEICGIRYDFQAKNLMIGARNVSRAWCLEAIRLCADTAYAMNRGGGDNKALLSELIYRLALQDKR